MRHWTKDKGDKGLGYVMADLLSKGIQIALPVSEHLPFDLIAISENNELIKVSVRYRKKKNGIVTNSMRSSWSDKHGVHIRKHDKNSYDTTAIYCPDTGKCYYINNEEISEWCNLRIDEPKTNQKNNIRYAKDYEDPNRIFRPCSSIGSEHVSSKDRVPGSIPGRGTNFSEG